MGILSRMYHDKEYQRLQSELCDIKMKELKGIPTEEHAKLRVESEIDFRYRQLVSGVLNVGVDGKITLKLTK